MAKAARNVVGKGELCALLGWSRPRLDRRLNTDRKFPVKKRGTAAGGWEFDAGKVMAYLGAQELPVAPTAPAPVSSAPDAPPLRNSTATAGGVQHAGESTARQRRDEAQAAMLEDKLRRERGDLVERHELEMVLGTMVAHLGKGLDGLPDMIVKKLGLLEETSDSIRALTDDLRVKMVNDLRTLFDFI